MRITEARLRRIIRESLLTEEKGQARDQAEVRSALEKKNYYISPYVVIDPAATVIESEVGSTQPADKSSISGASTVARSGISGETRIINSDLLGAEVGLKSEVVDSTISDNGPIHARNIGIYGCKIVSSKISRTAYLESRYSDSRLENSTAENCEVVRSLVMGNSNIQNCAVQDSELRGVKARNNNGRLELINLKSLGATIECVERKYDMMVEGVVNWAHLVDASVGSGVVIDCTARGAAYIEKAAIWGAARITGEPQIIGLTGTVKGAARLQEVEIFENAQISGKPKISGKVSGNAQVSGAAEVHGLAHITGDCKVSGQARMISGTFTTGEYTSGTHEGGDPPGIVDKLMSAIGI